MAIKNNYSGFVVAATGFDGDSDNDSDFGENLNRSIQKINRDYNISAGITNSYIDGYINQYGNSAELVYNIGLAYFEMGKLDKAKEYAQQAYDNKFPLPGLKNKLKEKGIELEIQ